MSNHPFWVLILLAANRILLCVWLKHDFSCRIMCNLAQCHYIWALDCKFHSISGFKLCFLVLFYNISILSLFSVDVSCEVEISHVLNMYWICRFPCTSSYALNVIMLHHCHVMLGFKLKIFKNHILIPLCSF